MSNADETATGCGRGQLLVLVGTDGSELRLALELPTMLDIVGALRDVNPAGVVQGPVESLLAELYAAARKGGYAGTFEDMAGAIAGTPAQIQLIAKAMGQLRAP